MRTTIFVIFAILAVKSTLAVQSESVHPDELLELAKQINTLAKKETADTPKSSAEETVEEPREKLPVFVASPEGPNDVFSKRTLGSMKFPDEPTVVEPKYGFCKTFKEYKKQSIIGYAIYEDVLSQWRGYLAEYESSKTAQAYNKETIANSAAEMISSTVAMNNILATLCWVK